MRGPTRGFMPLSQTRARRVPRKHYFDEIDDDDEPPPHTIVKRNRTVGKMTRTPKRVKKNKAPMRTYYRSQQNIDLFYRYLHRRMCVRVEMHGDATVLGKKGVPQPPHDPVLDLCIMGNAYRELDSEDYSDGDALRECVGADLSKRPSDEQLASMLMPCVLRTAGYNEELMAQFFGREGVVAAPMDEREVLRFADEMERLTTHKDERPIDPSWFQGGASQVQGYKKWAQAFKSWVTPESERGWMVSKVVKELRAAKTWEAANLTVQRLDCIGAYSAAQGLCTLVYGVYHGDAGKIFGDEFDKASMRTWCGFGPGPATSIEKMFGSHMNTLKGIRELVTTADDEFKRLELKFPYLKQPDGTPQPLGCIDVEHSLCYFSRYLSIKETLDSAEHEEELWRSVRQPQGASKGRAKAPLQFKRMKLKELVKLVGSKPERFVGMEAAIHKLRERLNAPVA